VTTRTRVRTKWPTVLGNPVTMRYKSNKRSIEHPFDTS
jgi:hypothetical protein